MLKKQKNRVTRHKRIRAKVWGSHDRPRLSVYRSHKHIHLQLIDDTAGKTLISASTLEVQKTKSHKQDQAAAASKLLADRALKKGIKEAVFDRGGYKYHGRVKRVAEAARETGLKM